MAVNLTEKRADELLEIDGIRLFTGRAASSTRPATI